MTGDRKKKGLAKLGAGGLIYEDVEIGTGTTAQLGRRVRFLYASFLIYAINKINDVS
jgi:FKBP-type peptidyl-prolyl cis-trans isomerase